jgi:predicted RNase H-like nuclease
LRPDGGCRVVLAAGVDGCRGGWFAALADIVGATVTPRSPKSFPTFGDVLAVKPALDIIRIDIPIGLLAIPVRGGRDCDIAARRLLPPSRKPAVFPTPTRPQTQAVSFAAAQLLGPINIQTFAICPKIREVDCLMTPALRSRVFEVHPELCFAGMNGAPIDEFEEVASWVYR